ncbi:L-aspartate oxidase [Pseudoxanthomonas indica]|uniref:L-aspartate oxidase n=1 Tax=Pseudoxanthomonas indica TaxID=428993 RepID=UPI0019A33F92|nr:FAD-binding protein [Pseudoxanthomonas indica]GGD52894.1 L-aspartate oxidase [Pseudoxanthomonas indica]
MQRPAPSPARRSGARGVRLIQAAPPPLVIVGSGIAGLVTALSAAPRPVRLISPLPVATTCATALAQGGIAAALSNDDTAAAHARDTLVAGAYHNDYDAVRYLVDHAAIAVRWLQAQGVGFDLDGTRFLLGRDGGHRRERTVHAGGDASGAALLLALMRAAEQASHIEWVAPARLDAIRLRNGHVAGVRVATSEAVEEWDCAELVLATGGCAALFAASTNPRSADGNGLALAMACGAASRDIEFVQFHPTALATPAQSTLPMITDALRSAGARLIDDADRPLMPGATHDAQVSPAKIAREVWLCRERGSQAWLDATGLHEHWLLHFPNVYALCRAHGVDPLHERIPVTSAAHFHIGGIAVDAESRSSVHGLYAVGEVACNGVHGANRLASNSLLEGVVFGRRLGHSLADIRLHPPGRGTDRWVDRGASADAESMPQLREMAWRALGPVRDGATLAGTDHALAQERHLAGTWQAGLLRCMLRAARARTQSLGSHFRRDDGHAAWLN